MGDNEGVQESWNMATATMKRLDELLSKSSLCAQLGNLIGWFNILMDLRRNLYPFMDEDDLSEVEKNFKGLPTGWCAGGKVSPKNFPIVNEVFDKVYIIFITTMKKKGLLMPKTTDTRKSVLDM